MKKIYIWGSEFQNDRVIAIQQVLKKNNLSVTWEKGLKLIKLIESDVIYIPPMEHRVYKYIFALILRKRVICDIYAPLYDTTVNDYKIYGKKHPIAKLHYLRDYFAMKFSNPVLFLNEAEAAHFIHSVGLNKKKVNYKILQLYRKEKKAAVLPFFNGKSTQITLSWTGSFIPLQGVDKILEAVKILKKTGFKFRLIIFGPDNEKRKNCEKVVEQEKLDDVIKFYNIWGDLQKWENTIVKECDVALGIFGDSDKAKSVVANKVIDGVAFKLPVITGRSKGLKLYFHGDDDIRCVNNTGKDIAAAVLDIASKSKEEIDLMRNKAYEVYENNFNEISFNKRVEEILRD